MNALDVQQQRNGRRTTDDEEKFNLDVAELHNSTCSSNPSEPQEHKPWEEEPLSPSINGDVEVASGNPKDTSSKNDGPSLWDGQRVLDGGWGWMVVLGSWLCHVIIIGLARSSGIIYVVLLERFQGSDAATAWVQGLQNTMLMLSGPIAGILCNRFSCRPVVIAAGIVLSTAWVISAFSTSLFYLYFSYSILGGLGGGLAFTPMYIVVGEYFEKKKGIAMGIASSGSGFGALILAQLTQYFLKTYMYFGTMVLCGGLCLNLMVAGALFRPAPKFVHTLKISDPNGNDGSEPPDIELHLVRSSKNSTRPSLEDPRHAEKHQTPSNNSKRTSCARGIRKYTALLRNRAYVMYGVNMISMPFCVISPLFFLPSLAKEVGVNKDLIPTLIAIAGIADIVGRFLWGSMFDLRRVRTRRRPLHSLSGIILGLVTVVTGTLSSFLPLAIAAATWGCVQASYHGQRMTVISEFVPRSQLSVATGFMVFFQGIGNLLALPTLGFLKDNLQTYRVCYYTGGSLFAVTCSFMLVDALCCYQKTTPKAEADVKR